MIVFLFESTKLLIGSKIQSTLLYCEITAILKLGFKFFFSYVLWFENVDGNGVSKEAQAIEQEFYEAI